MSTVRATPVNAVLAVLRAFVLAFVRGSLGRADRTSLRVMLDTAEADRLVLARRSALQPEPTWTITRIARASMSRVAVDDHLKRPASHPLHFRHAHPAESPGGGIVPVPDETRDLDQRESARNAGRHHRG